MKERQKAARVEKIAEAERAKAEERLQEERHSAVLERAESEQFKPRRYLVAETLASLFRIVALLGLVAFFCGFIALFGDPGLAVFVIAWGIGTFIVNSAFAEGLLVFLDIQRNTHRTAHFTELMWQDMKEKR